METKHASLNAAQLFVQCLESENVQYIFGVPGEENLTFLEALRTSKIKLIITRDEQSAVFMAATMGRLTGKVGVALSTLGPGATNLVTGVAYAQLGAMPLLVITGQKPIRKSKQGRFQIIDTVRMMEPITKFATSITSADRVSSITREAIRIAEEERPGAVHIELPEDIALEETTVLPIAPKKVRRPNADEKSIQVAVDAIESAKAPVVLVASGANRKLVRKQLGLFLNHTKIPFVSTQMGKGVLDEESELYLGTTALSSGDFAHKILEKSDLIIVIGHDVTEKPPLVFVPNKHKVLHIHFSNAVIDDVYIPTHEVVGDISHTLWQLTEKVKPQAVWDFGSFARIAKQGRDAINESATVNVFPLLPERIVADVQRTMPKDGVLSLDNGMYKIWFTRNYLAHEQNSLLLDNAFATMGAGLSAGIATKMLNPDKQVLVVAGDGGFMMNVAELETAKRLGLNLTILVLNDSGFGMIKWKQKDMHFPNFGLDLSNPDFVKLAESFGANGYRVSKADDLVSMLEHALKTPGIHLIECPVDYTKTNDALGKSLKETLNDTE